MSGMIVGGWEWVAAAWGISLGLLAVYVIAINLRLRREAARGAGSSPRQDSPDTP